MGERRPRLGRRSPSNRNSDTRRFAGASLYFLQRAMELNGALSNPRAHLESSLGRLVHLAKDILENRRRVSEPTSDHGLRGFKRLSMRSSNRHLYRCESATSAGRSNRLGSGRLIRRPCARHCTTGHEARNRASGAHRLRVCMSLLSDELHAARPPRLGVGARQGNPILLFSS